MPFQDLLQRLGQRFSDNLAASDKTIQDGTITMLDRIRMSNPDKIGPRLPDSPMPAELAESEMMGQGVMGSVAPARKAMMALAPEAKAAVVKSGPWMKEAFGTAVPVGEGLVNSAKDTIYTQGAKAAQRFEALRRKLGQ